MEQIDLIIIKYLSKNASSEEQTVLLTWLEEDEGNRIYFRSLRDAYDLGRLDFDMKESQVKSEWNKLLKTIPAARPLSRWRSLGYTFIRYAAVFVLGLLCLQFIHYLSGRPEEKLLVNTQIETGVGDRSKITLPDGSVVWVNACSSVLYDNQFGEKDRIVFLQGEAYFEVKTDSMKPFLVKADKFTYRVTGTSFNVYAFEEDEEISIALLEGGVNIEYDGKSHKLYPEEMFTYNKTSDEVTLRKTNVNLLSSWRQGEFVFDGMTFDELVRRLERSYNVKFVFENQKIRKETFGGTLRDYDSLETIMKVIQTSIPVKYRIEENILYIK
jgi:ferric-dicitrate binding protein FerR (iron transport regulator)